MSSIPLTGTVASMQQGIQTRIRPNVKEPIMRMILDGPYLEISLQVSESTWSRLTEQIDTGKSYNHLHSAVKAACLD